MILSNIKKNIKYRKSIYVFLKEATQLQNVISTIAKRIILKSDDINSVSAHHVCT